MPVRPNTYLAALVGIAALATGVHCDGLCNDIDCSGGLAWTAAPSDGTTLVPGEYRLDLVVEGTPHEIVCTIAAGLRDSECTDPVTPTGDSPFYVSVDLTPRQTGDTWDPDAPVEALRVRIADQSDVDDDDRTQSIRGPAKIEITLTLASRVLLDESFVPEYVRNEEFWGDAECGYCDEEVQDASSWAP